MVGVIEDFINNLPVVIFDNKRFIIDRHLWTGEIDNISVSMEQIPLLLAYALTIHRCQGMTLSQASIVLDESIFECGQAYVALSRLKSLNGLNLLKFNPNVFRVNTSVKEYYKHFN
jgi:ATP-dependent DNA helicase PIF1